MMMWVACIEAYLLVGFVIHFIGSSVNEGRELRAVLLWLPRIVADTFGWL